MNSPTLKMIYYILFPILVLSYPLGRMVEKIWLSAVSDIFIWMGALWLAIMLYLFLACLVFDLLRGFSLIFPLVRKIVNFSSDHSTIVCLATIAIVLMTVGWGLINALIPRVQSLELVIPKTTAIQKMKVVAVSDIHLGTIVGKQRFCQIISKINSLSPDLVLLAGDVVDEDLAPVIKQDLGSALSTIQSKYGVFAVTGNHEYIGGVDAATDYLQNYGVSVLRDSVVKIVDSIYLIGREDRSIRRFSGKARTSLDSLMQGVDRNYPCFLLDHQPFELSEAARNGIDLQICGHTHHGQLWPLNLITRMVYEKSWGYLKRGDTHYYISSGAGTWGPPVRIGNYPEIVEIVVHFLE